MSPRLTIAGAGIAGLVAAARARELGATVTVLEKGDRAGGSMLLSSCVVWRHRTLEDMRAECPSGDAGLQRLIVERLDDALNWLRALGAPVTAETTGNPRTIGIRLDPRGLTDALFRRAGDVRFDTPLDDSQAGPLILATGGFGGELARRQGVPLRANPWSEGDGRRFATSRGAALSGDENEFYGRLLPDVAVAEGDFVRASQLYGRWAVLTDRAGHALAVEPSWSEIELPQALLRAGGRGWLVADRAALERRVRERKAADMVAVAEELGADVRRSETVAGLSLGALGGDGRLRAPPFVAVPVAAAVTHTVAGLAADTSGRVLDERGSPLPGLFAAGVDVGGVASGGYASGLAQALVQGLAAAETAVSEL